MALIAGSPCFPNWGAMTRAWRGATWTWRSLASPIMLGAMAAAAGGAGTACGGTTATARCGETGSVATAGGRLVAGEPRGPSLLLLYGGDGLARLSASANATTLMSPAGSAAVEASAGAAARRLFLAVASGAAARPVELPVARLSRGRMSWLR
jgi:hypothetical protein